MPDFNAPLGRSVDGGAHRCTYSPGDTEAADCGRPATWHIAWTVELDCGLACDAHMAYALRFPYLDRHLLSPDCGMPNAAWFFDEQRCRLPSDGAAQSQAAAQPHPATA